MKKIALILAVAPFALMAACSDNDTNVDTAIVSDTTASAMAPAATVTDSTTVIKETPAPGSTAAADAANNAAANANDAANNADSAAANANSAAAQ